MIDPQQAPAQSEHPYRPPGPDPLVFEQFKGMNTQSTRQGVPDAQAYWLDGFMPIAPRNLRTLYGVGTSIYTNTAVGIAFFATGNIASTSYHFVILLNGSIQQVNSITGATTQISPAGTLTNPTVNTVDVKQWGSQYIIIVSSQTNGYFVWDGTTFYKAGGLAPIVTITNGGTNYSSTPTITTSGGSGGGATFSATVSGGVITAIKITNGGVNWKAGETVTLVITDATGTSATATVSLMPFAISGTGVETYTGRVWVINGPVLTWSAPGSVFNFATSAGGGNTTSADSFLRVGYRRLVQSNGFLYLIADSSINYVSGVATSGSPPTTTFTNQNADPETGTPYPASVETFGRNIVFANAAGIYVLYGASAVKKSSELDGVFNTVPNFGGLSLSSAKAIIFAKKIWMILVPIIDPISGQSINKLFMWDGEIWWASTQDVTLTYIKGQEINSVFTAWGTDGASIYPLFQTPSTAFTKTAQSKLWDTPGYEYTKGGDRLWGLVHYYSSLSPSINVSIDNETGANSQSVMVGPPTMTWTNNTGATMTWTNNTGATMVWASFGNATFGPQAVGQAGILLGMTATTNCADMSLVSLKFKPDMAQYRG